MKSSQNISAAPCAVSFCRFAPTRLHAKRFEVQHLIAGLDRYRFIHSTMPGSVVHHILNTAAAHGSARDGGRSFAHFRSVPVHRHREVRRVNFLKSLVETGISLHQFGHGVLEELCNKLESLLSEQVEVEVGELLLDTKIAGTGTCKRIHHNICPVETGSQPLRGLDFLDCLVKFSQSTLDRLDDIQEGLVSIRPGRNGLPSFGTPSSLPKSRLCQSDGRRMTGMTLACPFSCLSMACFISRS